MKSDAKFHKVTVDARARLDADFSVGLNVVVHLKVDAYFHLVDFNVRLVVGSSSFIHVIWHRVRGFWEVDGQTVVISGSQMCLMPFIRRGSFAWEGCCGSTCLKHGTMV